MSCGPKRPDSKDIDNRLYAQVRWCRYVRPYPGAWMVWKQLSEMPETSRFWPTAVPPGIFLTLNCPGQNPLPPPVKPLAKPGSYRTTRTADIRCIVTRREAFPLPAGLSRGRAGAYTPPRPGTSPVHPVAGVQRRPYTRVPWEQHTKHCPPTRPSRTSRGGGWSRRRWPMPGRPGMPRCS
jgi:hypothetical protein